MFKRLLLLVLFPFVAAVFLYVVYTVITSSPRSVEYFSLDDVGAIYRIGRQEGHYTIQYYQDELHAKNGFVNSEVFVGNSSVELEPFLGDNVRISGSYEERYSDQQCIVGKCRYIYKRGTSIWPFGRRKQIVIDVDGVERVDIK